MSDEQKRDEPVGARAEREQDLPANYGGRNTGGGRAGRAPVSAGEEEAVGDLEKGGGTPT
ncbi:MAG: hypothetical protein OXN97_15965 [Bryobacterales bacterium]|nr:hypothetical protein [Bryobacterales bacterium]